MRNMISPLKFLLRDERGGVLFLVGLSVTFFLLIAVGVAVDMARGQILQQRISSALDAAGLAAAQTIDTPDNAHKGDNQGWVQSEVNRFFLINFPTGYLGSSKITPIATLSADRNTIVSTAVTTQQTVFMNMFGFKTMQVGTGSTVTRSNNGTGIELVLVLDNTGSMQYPVNPSVDNTSKLSALQSASEILFNILFGSNDTVANQYVGIVPFTQAVNIGTQNSGWVTPNPLTPFNPADYLSANNYYWGASSSDKWFGCVEARDLTDATPSAQKFPVYYFSPVTPYYSDQGYKNQYYGSSSDPVADNGGYVNFNPWTQLGVPRLIPTFPFLNSAQKVSPLTRLRTNVTAEESPLSPTATASYPNPQGPNRFCPQPVTPMSVSRTAVSNAISLLTAQGDTNLDVGVAWGYRMLSPNWRGFWGGDMATNNLPKDYNATNSKKIVILMTDGSNHYGNGNYTAYGFLSQGQLGTTDPATAITVLDDKTRQVCDSLKSSGITVYTVGFGTTDTDTTSSTYVNGPLLKYCATDLSKYFLAPTNDQLKSAFQQIGNSIQNIRVSK